jgi:Uma2 family endonuclease
MQGALRAAEMTEAEYLAFEESSPEKHEFAGGQIFAMSGASKMHNKIIGNIYSAFRQKSTCDVFFSDVKCKGDRIYYYPDVMLSCESSSDTHFETHPCLVVEVISPSTAKIDRVEKLTNYKKIPSLLAYVMVEQDERRIDIYRRHENFWVHESLEDDTEFRLPCVDAPLTLNEIYTGINVSSPVHRFAMDVNHD